MSYYPRHVFFCLNEREDGGPCCTQHNAEAMFDHMKKRCKKMGLWGEGKPRRLL